MPIQKMIAIRNSNNAERKVALLMALHCAPLLKRMVVANVLTVTVCEAKMLRQMLKGTNIEVLILGKREAKVILYLYRSKELWEYLSEPENEQFLKMYGYQCGKLDGLLCELSERMSIFEGKEDFPHELGVFLGYPLQDVKGFIENEGRNFAFMGYWKVYHNEEESRKRFLEFDAERESVVLDVVNGKSIAKIAC